MLRSTANDVIVGYRESQNCNSVENLTENNTFSTIWARAKKRFTDDNFEFSLIFQEFQGKKKKGQT